MKQKIIVFAILIGALCMSACGQRSVPTGNTGKITSVPSVSDGVDMTIMSPPIPEPTPTPEPTATPIPEDTTAPELVLFGEPVMKVIARSEYTEPGFEATDDRDGELTAKVEVSGEVDVNWCGSYTLTYTVSDAAGNVTAAERTVEVAQPETVYPEGKVVYLTFDDGPGQYTEDVLALLEKYNAKATFFACESGAESKLKKIKEAGHAIGAHCRSHDYDVVYESDEAYFADLEAIMQIIYEQTGEYTTLIRFPGGSSNKVSMICPGLMTRVTEKVTNMGYQYFDWNVSAEDSVTKDTAEILSCMITDIPKYKYPIVLQHPEHRKFSLDAVEDLLIWCVENGYTCLPLEPTSPTVHHRIKN